MSRAFAQFSSQVQEEPDGLDGIHHNSQSPKPHSLVPGAVHANPDVKSQGISLFLR